MSAAGSSMRVAGFTLLLFTLAPSARSEARAQARAPRGERDPDSIRWQRPSLDGTRYAPLESNRRAPGEPFTYALELPAGFQGHYCFEAPAEATVLRGDLRETGGGSVPRHVRAGQRAELEPGVIHEVETESGAVVVIRTRDPFPAAREPRAPGSTLRRC